MEKAAEVEKASAKKTAVAEAHFLEIDAYDPATKSITFAVWSDADTSYSGVITVTENTITWEGKVAAAGKEYRVKEPLVFSDDRMTATTKAEISTDGKTWQPYFDGKYTKATPTARKWRKQSGETSLWSEGAGPQVHNLPALADHEATGTRARARLIVWVTACFAEAYSSAEIISSLRSFSS